MFGQPNHRVHSLGPWTSMRFFFRRLERVTPRVQKGRLQVHTLHLVPIFQVHERNTDQRRGNRGNISIQTLGHRSKWYRFRCNHQTYVQWQTVQSSNVGEEFSRLLGLEWKYMASHSPHSNGSCKRNHWTVDGKFEKFIKDTQGQVDLQRCLAEAFFVYKHNS